MWHSVSPVVESGTPPQPGGTTLGSISGDRKEPSPPLIMKEENDVGIAVGVDVGIAVVGTKVGAVVGISVGNAVGASTGAAVGAATTPISFSSSVIASLVFDVGLK